MRAFFRSVRRPHFAILAVRGVSADSVSAIILALFLIFIQNNNIMAKKTAPLLPSVDLRLQQFGERLQLARLRRGLAAKQVAERAGMSPMTLRSLERGGSGVTIGAYLAVMQVLGLDSDLDLVAKADPVGRALQDSRLRPGTTSSRPMAEAPSGALPRPLADRPFPLDEPFYPGQVKDTEQDFLGLGGDFVSADDLSSLLDLPGTPMKKAL
jgi:transcriptional regulator with XRE-family HTH domain